MGGSNQGLGGNGDEVKRGWEHWWEPEIKKKVWKINDIKSRKQYFENNQNRILMKIDKIKTCKFLK